MGGPKRGRSASTELKVTTRSQKRCTQGSSSSSLPSTLVEHATDSLPLDSRFEGVLDRDTDLLHLGIDFGTSSCAAYYAIVPKDSTNPLKISPEKLDIHQGQPLLPTHGALLPVDNTKDAVLVFGNDVDTATKAGEISWDNVCSDLKQANFLTKMDDLPAGKRESSPNSTQSTKEFKDAEAHRKIFLNHGWTGKKQTVVLERMEDVVDILLRYFLMEIKSAIRDVSLLSKEAIDTLLSGHRAEKFGDRVRVGVAIPEIWTSQQMLIYQCLRKAGFHEELEFLSEGRCALAKGLENVLLDDTARNNTDDQTKLLQELKQRVFVGLDDGGFTLDGAVMELVEQDSFVKLAVVREGLSSQNRSNRANEVFKTRIPGVFGRTKLPTMVKQLGLTENDFVLIFERGFEDAKCSMSLAIQGKVRIVYKGLDALEKDSNRRAAWGNFWLKLDENVFPEYLREAVDEKFAPARPIERLRKQVTTAALQPIHVIFSGDGSKSKLLHEKAQRYFSRGWRKGDTII